MSRIGSPRSHSPHAQGGVQGVTGKYTAVHIPEANPAWGLIFQSGVTVACTVGIPLAPLLKKELGLSGEQLRPVDVFLLDGMPVDDPETCIVPHNARLALAAGLPGIAGLAMKQGSAVRALRAGITHAAGTVPDPRPGSILLSLYSLVLPLLAGHFLQRGVTVRAAQLLRYARFAPDDCCLLDANPIAARDLPLALAGMPEAATFLLTADRLCQK